MRTKMTHLEETCKVLEYVTMDMQRGKEVNLV